MIKCTTRKPKYFLCILLVYVLISWINPHVGARYMLAPDMLALGTLKPLNLAPNMFAPDTLMLLKLGPLGCTLLQYKVHLSMFHSSLASKIWHTST
jgi:hypothetical protein